jgi:hypothetical protein
MRKAHVRAARENGPVGARKVAAGEPESSEGPGDDALSSSRASPPVALDGSETTPRWLGKHPLLRNMLVRGWSQRYGS